MTFVTVADDVPIIDTLDMVKVCIENKQGFILADLIDLRGALTDGEYAEALELLDIAIQKVRELV